MMRARPPAPNLLMDDDDDGNETSLQRRIRALKLKYAERAVRERRRKRELLLQLQRAIPHDPPTVDATCAWPYAYDPGPAAGRRV